MRKSPRGTSASTQEAPALSAIEMLLAAGWVLIPAVQYIGSVQRTYARLYDPSLLGPLALMDLTPQYLVLLALTATLVVSRAIRRSERRP